MSEAFVLAYRLIAAHTLLQSKDQSTAEVASCDISSSLVYRAR
jgi:hypothetical protein